jgi:hypothetical protein
LLSQADKKYEASRIEADIAQVIQRQRHVRRLQPPTRVG